MSSLGVNCKNGIIAPGLNISASDFSELSTAHRNGTATQIAANPAIVITMAFDVHLELRHSTFSTAKFSRNTQKSHAKMKRCSAKHRHSTQIQYLRTADTLILTHISHH